VNSLLRATSFVTIQNVLIGHLSVLEKLVTELLNSKIATFSFGNAANPESN